MYFLLPSQCKYVFLDKLKRSEYRLQLRKEDCQVYYERIRELNEEIQRLKEERERDKGKTLIHYNVPLDLVHVQFQFHTEVTPVHH